MKGQAESSIKFIQSDQQIILANGRLQLTVETGQIINPSGLKDLSNGIFYADDTYAWSWGEPPKLEGKPAVIRDPDGGCVVKMKGKAGVLAVELTYAAPAGEPGVIYETVRFSNASDTTIDTSGFKCGFAKKIQQDGKVLRDGSEIRFCPVPYRCGTDGKVLDVPLSETLEHGMPYRAWAEEPVDTAVWGSEGWVWTSAGQAFLVSKYNSDAMEWSLMEPENTGSGRSLRFAGAGMWKYGNPVKAAALKPGESFTFGETRMQVVDGGWQEAYYAYRRYLEKKGCTLRKGYNPPIHWNELYDNQFFFKICNICEEPDFLEQNKKLLKAFYTLDDMKSEAAKASEIGCEALYMDPGWDTGPSHHIWDAERLGPMADYMDMMKKDYGLRVSLWIGLNGVPPTYADPDACPPEARVMGPDGKPDEKRKDYYVHCVASPAFRKTKIARLSELCRHQIAFLMLDSTQFSGQCHDPSHGHGIPLNTEEHAKAILNIVQDLKKRYPRLLIEVHDFISGPSGVHYTPFYYGYARPDSFDCLWGHEFMWNPMDDIVSGRAISLYYFNLAVSIPIYLHINLKTDNMNSLVFWWFASTCRHLGIGGKHPDPGVWEAHKRAMKLYKENKAYFVQGQFYGLDESVHVHTLEDAGICVVNCFNLTDEPVKKNLKIKPDAIGLPSGELITEHVPSEWDGKTLFASVEIPARGHQLLKIRRKT